MQRIFVAGVFFLANVAAPALADCTAYGGYMTSTQISNLLDPGGTFPSTVYTCYNNGSHRENNERLFSRGPGGQVQDYKLGAAPDPPAIVGTYTGSSLTVGTISYTYPVGGSLTFTYNICITPSGTTYQFVNTATGANLSIQVTTGPGTC